MRTTMTLAEFRTEQTARALSPEAKLRRLTGGHERLKSRTWTDAELKAIPDELVEFAYAQSAALREEFRSFSVFSEYRRACIAGKVRHCRT